MEKKVREFVSSLSDAEKARVFDRYVRLVSSIDLDLPEPLYECCLSYRFGKSTWRGYVSSAVLDGDSIVIHTSSDPCGVDESLCNLASALFLLVCEGVYPFCEASKHLIEEVHE